MLMTEPILAIKSTSLKYGATEVKQMYWITNWDEKSNIWLIVCPFTKVRLSGAAH